MRHGPCRRFSTQAPTSRARRVHLAVIGSGPAGFYAADSALHALPKVGIDVKVDIYEKLPVPFGLVRFGVAPDHPEVKLVENKFEELAKDPRVTFIGNLAVNDSIKLADLRQHYDAIISCTGAQSDRVLGIEGESLDRVYSAREFVAWYNGLPLGRRVTFDLATPKTAVVLGVGNVALDVARILMRPPDELAKTDIIAPALAALRSSSIANVRVVGRRSVAQAMFTTKELRELTAISGCKIVVDPNVFQLNSASQEELDKDRAKKRQLDLLQKSSISPATAATLTGYKLLHLDFLLSPSYFLGDTAVSGVRFDRTALSGPASKQQANSTGQTVEIPAEIVFRSIGYKALPFAPLPYDETKGIVPNLHGRVQWPSEGEATAGCPMYVAGWQKRGPSGIIGTNKFDAEETVMQLLSDLSSGAVRFPDNEKPGFAGIQLELAQKGVKTTNYSDWQRIDKEERRRGQALGKPREKITSVEEMLHILEKS